MDSKRRILLLVSGMSPQIITETLYALVVQQQPSPWLPDEVHLITTEQGRRNATLQLLEDKRRFFQFLRDYKITHPIHFDSSTIHLICDSQGSPLADLRTPLDNEAAADTICDVIRTFTQDPANELNVSLAGGRKTMGFYAGYALSLFGRPQDRLSHVLVDENYESNRDFFYPTPDTQVIYDREGKPLNAHEAKVWLAEIPFVRMRSSLPPNLLEGTHSFSEAVDLARRATETPRLKLQPSSLTFSMNGVTGKLSPTHMAILLWAATRHQQGKTIDPVISNDDRSGDLQEFLNLVEEKWVDLHPKTVKALDKEGLNQKWLEQNISRLNGELRKTLGPELAERCKLASRQMGRKRSYSLPENLEIFIE
jgi:CRISPR-associated protein (TIGR02584 family)